MFRQTSRLQGASSIANEEDIMASTNRTTTAIDEPETDSRYTHPGDTAHASATSLRQRPGTTKAVAKLIRFLETGTVPEGLFAPDVFTDLALPRWRVQGSTREATIALRLEGHPMAGEVRVERIEQTAHGFTLEFEERWEAEGQRWYSREMIRADVVGESIVELSIYCTGDWDEARQREHAGNVRLLRR